MRIFFRVFQNCATVKFHNGSANSDGVFAADYEFDIIFDYDVILRIQDSVPSKLCPCARTHRFQGLRRRINLLCTDILFLIIQIQ